MLIFMLAYLEPMNFNKNIQMLPKSDQLFEIVLALTATRSIHTREHIIVNLLQNKMNICYQVYEKPNDPVIAFLNDLIQQETKIPLM